MWEWGKDKKKSKRVVASPGDNEFAKEHKGSIWEMGELDVKNTNKEKLENFLKSFNVWKEETSAKGKVEAFWSLDVR